MPQYNLRKYIYWQEPDYVKDDQFITINTTDYKTHMREALRKTLKLWKTCPKKDGSLDSIFIGMGVDYRSGLGNQVLAKMFDCRQFSPN
jgi:hypothetical protein